MSLHPDHRTFDDAAPITISTESNVVPLRADPHQPAHVKKAKTHKKHPPATPRPLYTGKRVQDSPYYIAPTDRLDLGLAITLDRKLTPSARDVFVLIMAHYNNSKGHAFPSRERMAELLGLTKTAISAAIALLVERGWLRVEQTRADGHKGVNHYFPQLDKVAATLTAAGFKVVKTGPSEASKVRSDDEQGPVSEGSKVRSDAVSRSGKPDTNPETEPSEKNPEREPGAPEGVVSPRGFAKGAWFSMFWEQYPHKIAEPAARRMFVSIVKNDGELFETIVAAAWAYAKRLKVTGDFPASPVSWLRDERWKDKPALVKPEAARRTYRE